MKNETSDKTELPGVAAPDNSLTNVNHCMTIVAQNGLHIDAPGRGDEDQALHVVPPASNNGGNLYDNTFDAPDNWEYKRPLITDNDTVGLHWLSVTLFCEKSIAFKMYMDIFFDTFGETYELDHGTRFFRGMMAAGDTGFRILYDPVTISKKHNSTYVSFVIPGAACEKLDPTFVSRLWNGCNERGIAVKCTRLDYKFDQCNFSPYQFRWMLNNSVVKMTANRKNIRHIQNDELNELGNPGQISVYVGDRSSCRSICCYDTHGFTRLEMRNKEEWANELFNIHRN